MTGHGSPPPPDRANHPARQVSPWRTGDPELMSLLNEEQEISIGMGRPERFPQGVSVHRMGDRRPRRVSDTTYKVESEGGVGRGRGLYVRTPHRARVAAENLSERLTFGRDIYTGRPR